MQVRAIYGRLLTAWSTAGVLGPVLVNYIRQARIDSGVPKEHAYDLTMFIVAGLLLIGFTANVLVRPVHSKYHYVGATAGEALPAASMQPGTAERVNA